MLAFSHTKFIQAFFGVIILKQFPKKNYFNYFFNKKKYIYLYTWLC